MYEDASYQIERSGDLPCETEVLEQKHERSYQQAFKALETQAAAVLDTEAYASSKGSLESGCKERYGRLKTKNIQLWKVHSDEATNCAKEKWTEYSQSCGLLNFQCPSNWIWLSHKSKSRTFLMDCFADAKVRVDKHKGAMPENMREGVFTVWYETDMAAAASSAWWNTMVVLFMTLVVGVCTFIGIGALPNSMNFKMGGSERRPGSPARAGSRPAAAAAPASYVAGSAMPFGGSSAFSGHSDSSRSGYGNLDPPRGHGGVSVFGGSFGGR